MRQTFLKAIGDNDLLQQSVFFPNASEKGEGVEGKEQAEADSCMAEEGQSHQFWKDVQEIVGMLHCLKEPVVNEAMVLDQHQFHRPNGAQQLDDPIEHGH